MKLDAFLANAAAAAPTSARATSVGFPRLADPANGVDATVIGAYWFYQVYAETKAVLDAAGIQPDIDSLTQLRDAINALILASVPAAVELANQAEHLQANPPGGKAATPLGVKAAVDRAIAQLVGGAPGALDTLNELAQALNDFPDAYARLLALINARAALAGATFTGAVRFPTPPTADDSTRGATTEWVRNELDGRGQGLSELYFNENGLAITKAAAGTEVAVADITGYRYLEFLARFTSVGTAVSETAIRVVRANIGSAARMDGRELLSVEALQTDVWAPDNTHLRLKNTGNAQSSVFLHAIHGIAA